MQTYKECQIVKSPILDIVQESIDFLISEGWEKMGEMFITDLKPDSHLCTNWYCQVMVLPK